MYSLNWDYANKLAHGCILALSVDWEPFPTTLQEFKAISDHFVFSLEENTPREITRLLWRYRFGKVRFKNVFRPHENEKPASNSSGFD